MIRLVIVALIIYVIWRLWKKAVRQKARPAEKQEALPGEMIACERCGTFILDSEAVKGGGRMYCSEGCYRGN